MTAQTIEKQEPGVAPLTTLTGELQIPVFKDTTAASIATSTLAANTVIETAAQTAKATLAGDLPMIDQAVDAMGEAEARKFIASLEGDADVDTPTLRNIASKLLAGPLKDSFKASHAQQALSATVKALQAEIATLKNAQTTTSATISETREEQEKLQRFNKLSAACATEKIDLETILLDKDVALILNTRAKDESSALTLSQEITQWMMRGEFAKAADLVKRAVAFAKPEQDPQGKPIAPATSAGAAVAVEQKTYEQELSEITLAYSRSNKTFADGQARAAKLNALKVKHGRT